MDTATLISILVGGSLVYTTMAGVSWQLGGAHWDDPGPFFIGVLWPLLLPALLGTRLAKRLATRGVRLPKARVIE